MKRYLLITSLDVKRQPNNREHHLIRHIAPSFSETWVVFRKRNDAAENSSRIRQLLLSSSEVRQHNDTLTYLEVDPMFNTPPNMAMDVTRTYDASSEGAGGRKKEHWFYQLLNGLGVIKDLSFIFFMFLYTLVKTPGRFDVGVGMGPFGNAVVYLLKMTGKVRCRIYEDRDYEVGFFHNPIRRAFVAWLERAGVRSADQVISIGYRLASLREQQSGRSIPVVTTGVDYSRYSSLDRELTDAPQLIYIGNITFWSGLEIIIEGFALIRKHFPAATLKIVGEGLPGYQKQLLEQAQKSGAGDAIHFTGRVENHDIPAYLEQAHLGIALFQPMSLRAYAFPLKLLEYMAAALPVIANHGMETEDVILKHDFGVCVDFSADEFATSAVNILSDADLYHRLANNARKAAKEYDWPVLMEREYLLLQKACANNNGG